MTRLGARRRLAALATLFGAAALLVGAARAWQDKHPLDLAGTNWVAMSEIERRAWLRGFLAGAAVGQITAQAADSAAVRGAVDSLRARRATAFPFGPPVYLTRVSDFYYYENHRELPLWYGMWEMNAVLRRHGDGGR